jgi:hypothetical protein
MSTCRGGLTAAARVFKPVPTFATEEHPQIGDSPVINICIGMKEHPSFMLRIAPEICLHVLMDLFLPVDTHSSINAHDFILANSGVGRNIPVGVRNAHIRRVITNTMTSTLDSRSYQSLRKGGVLAVINANHLPGKVEVNQQDSKPPRPGAWNRSLPYLLLTSSLLCWLLLARHRIRLIRIDSQFLDRVIHRGFAHHAVQRQLVQRRQRNKPRIHLKELSQRIAPFAPAESICA